MKKRLNKILRFFGPGLITGAADDDPSGIATYTQTGARFGYQLIWTSIYIYPLIYIVQEICARIGLVTGKGIASVIRRNYSHKVLYLIVFLLLFANIVNIGADLGAMASISRKLFNIPYRYAIITITFISIFLEIVLSYKIYSKFLKILSITLFAYIIAAFSLKNNIDSLSFSFLIPTISLQKSFLINLVAIFGTTISPYLFFWQAGEEIEEEIAHKKLRIFGMGIPKITKRDINIMRLDIKIGMLIAVVVMFSVILTSANALSKAGITNIETADQAALALKPLVGDFAFVLFSLGILSTGFLAIPILAGSSSYALSETLGWKEGLYRKMSQAHGFYGVIILSTVFGLFLNYIDVKPFKMLYYAAIINGIVSPILLFFIMIISNNSQILGKYTNNKLTNFIGWLTVLIMSLCALSIVM